MRRFVPLVALTALACHPPAQARLIESWPFDRLLKEADVVVLAKAVSSKDSGEVFKDRAWSVDFAGVDTAFQVEAVLKGEVRGGRLTLLHYRLPAGHTVINGPLLVTFPTKGVNIKSRRVKAYLPPPRYLLFLKRRGDGRYEAVSGQIDPALAVRELHEPGSARSLAEMLGDEGQVRDEP
jgi:hypothetical protein